MFRRSVSCCNAKHVLIQVEDVYFPKERSSGRRRPFCFVTFASQKVLIQCLSMRCFSMFAVTMLLGSAQPVFNPFCCLAADQMSPLLPNWMCLLLMCFLSLLVQL